MKHKYLGIKVLLNFYCFLLLFFVLAFFTASPQIAFLGKLTTQFITFLINLILGIFIFSLYFTIKKAKMSGLFLALFFHGLFFVNSVIMVFDKEPILKIEGLILDNYDLKLLINSFNIGINIIIIVYLLSHRRYFIDKN